MSTGRDDDNALAIMLQVSPRQERKKARPLTSLFVAVQTGRRILHTFAIPSLYMSACLSTQKTSKVRILKRSSWSETGCASGDTVAAEAACVEVTVEGALLLPLAALACCGAGTKDMQLRKACFALDGWEMLWTEENLAQ